MVDISDEARICSGRALLLGRQKLLTGTGARVSRAAASQSRALTMSLSGRPPLWIARYARTIVRARIARLIDSHGRSKRLLGVPPDVLLRSGVEPGTNHPKSKSSNRLRSRPLGLG
jgi:hypothetical protein